MTDEEIIKALELCGHCPEVCKKCPLYDEDENCSEILIRECFGLVNRQRDEIAKLEKQRREDCNVIFEINHEFLTVKSGIIKEIAARLREYVKFDINNDVYIKGADVDKVLNEMER